MGFLICFNLEHCGVAYAYELLCEDSECNCSKLCEETTGNRTSCIKHIYINRLDRYVNKMLICSACIALFLAALASRNFGIIYIPEGPFQSCYYSLNLRSHKSFYRFQIYKHNR